MEVLFFKIGKGLGTSIFDLMNLFAGKVWLFTLLHISELEHDTVAVFSMGFDIAPRALILNIMLTTLITRRLLKRRLLGSYGLNHWRANGKSHIEASLVVPRACETPSLLSSSSCYGNTRITVRIDGKLQAQISHNSDYMRWAKSRPRSHPSSSTTSLDRKDWKEILCLAQQESLRHLDHRLLQSCHPPRPLVAHSMLYPRESTILASLI